jgi:hypothetical protein
MKMIDVEYKEEKITLLFKFPIIKANLAGLKEDFEKVYTAALNTDMAEEVPEEHLQNMKTDLFTAFCHGARISTDLNSSFRKQFVLPEEVMNKISEIKKPSLILPNNEIKQPVKPKLIID